MVEQQQADSLLTPAEVAALFRVNPKTVTRWARAGKITAIRTLGGHRRFRATESVAAWTNSTSISEPCAYAAGLGSCRLPGARRGHASEAELESNTARRQLAPIVVTAGAVVPGAPDGPTGRAPSVQVSRAALPGSGAMRSSRCGHRRACRRSGESAQPWVWCRASAPLRDDE